MFKLLIECSKDIDSLKINFSDGTSVVTSNDKPKKEKESKSDVMGTRVKNNYTKKEEYLDTSEDFSINTEIVEKPNIPDNIRPPKISDELQNFDF